MTKIIQKQNQELYQCEECGFKYREKEWAEKCEAWCKEHNSCNLEITAHAVIESEENSQEKKLLEQRTKILTRVFYTAIGITSSLILVLVFYWSLRLNSSIASIIQNTYGEPLYFWPYTIMTFGIIILFGISIPLLVYRWRRFGPPKVKGQLGTGFGSLVGVAASACPVCGSVLLSAIGITAGLAAFPLQGLELKALSFGLMALPIWLMKKDMKRMELDRDNGLCPVPKDASFKESDREWFLGLLALIIVLVFFGWDFLKTDPALARLNGILNPQDNKIYSANFAATGNKLFDETVKKVLPEKGWKSKIVLGDSIVKLVENEVIDQEKFEAIYQSRGGLSGELRNVLTTPSSKSVHLTRENANVYVNLLWPLGLANYMSTNKESPVNGESLFNFASTGGWGLGKEENGGTYFNKFKIVELTPEQETLATRLGQNTYRPCCNNSTFFQDCNHGSALLGLLELGTSQGLSEDELYKEALAFNSFWFPHNYIQTALYFKAVKGIDWEDLDPKEIMGFDYSAISPWIKNVQQEIAKIPNLLPQTGGGAGCGV